MYLKNKDLEKRYSIFPIQHQGLWEKYKDMETTFWKAQEVDFSSDEFDDLEKSQKEYLKKLLLFFANSDSVVADNLALNFLQEDIPEEAKMFYSAQLYNENVHNETYSLIIENYIKDSKEKEDAFNSIFTQPVIAKKMEWAIRWINNGTFAEKVVAFSAVEMIMFSSTFAGIFGFKSLDKKLEGLYVANEWISRDELKHGKFAAYFYNNYVEDKLDKDLLKNIILGAYYVEEQFIKDCFGEGVIGFSKDKMIQYVQYITDNVLSYYDIDSHFKVDQPFAYMDLLALPRRDNFFEKRVTEYKSIVNDGVVIDDDLEF
jgi:ribonucleoside-diphosphate reductase beta chain